MNKFVKVIMWVVIVIVVVGVVAGIMAFSKKPPVNIQDKNETNVGYDNLEDLDSLYSIAEGIDDKCLVVEKDSSLYNIEVENKFLENVNANNDAELRVVQEDASGAVQIVDVIVDDVNIIVRSKDGASQTVIENKYNRDAGYKLETVTRTLNDGSEWVGCYVTRENGESIVLYGYVK